MAAPAQQAGVQHSAHLPGINLKELQTRRKHWMEIKTALHKLEGFWDAFLLAAVNGHLPSDLIQAKNENGMAVIVYFNERSEWRYRALRFYQACAGLAMANSKFIGYVNRRGQGHLPPRYRTIGKYFGCPT